MLDIIPAIFEKDWAELERKVRLVAPHVSWVQIDFSDGSLVPTQSFFDLAEFAKLVQLDKKLHFEAHLLVAGPEKYVHDLARAGFERIIAQVEANDPRLFLEEAAKESVEAGLAIDGATELEAIEPFLEEIDVVLVMMAEAGATDGTIQPENVEKIRAIRRSYPDLPIGAEEGITDQTIKVIKDAGVTRAVVTNHLFKNNDIAGIIERLKNG